jgi:multiple sugar transport system substrate-binding protein
MNHRARTGRLRRLAALCAALTAVASVAAGCTGSDPVDDGKDAAEGYDPGAKVTLQWWTGQTEDLQTVAEGLAKEYTKLHPNVTIEASTGAATTDELLTKLSASFTGGSYPDISYAYGSWATQLADSGRTQNLTTFVAQPDIAWDDFPSAARATATVGDKVIGFPAIVDNLALLYNKKLFDGAGVAYPTDDWSWDDFRAAAKKITNAANNTYGTAYSVSGGEDTTWHLWPLLWQRGGKIIDGKKATFNSDAGIASLETLRQMAVEDRSMYLDQTDEKYQQLFNDGHVGMVLTGPWVLQQTQEAGIDYGVVNMPGVDGDHQTVSGPDLWVLFNKKDPDRAGASREFVKWLTSKEIDPQWSMANGNLPLRASEKDTPEFAAYVKQYPGAQKYFDNLRNCKQPRPTVPGYVEMSGYVGDAVAKVLQGAAKPKEALDDAAKKSASALEG